MNIITNKISISNNRNITFQSRNNQTEHNKNNNSTGNILLSSLIALSSLTIPTIETNANTNIDKIEIISNDIKDETATKMKLDSTANQNIYFDKKNNIYYSWNEKKQTFNKAKNIDSVFDTGYIKTKKGSYLDPNGKMFVENHNGKYLWPCNTIGYELPYEMAKIYGYNKTSISHLNVFFDKKNKQYLKWNTKEDTWNTTQITDVSPSGNFISNNKAYRSLNNGAKEITKKEFYADKQNLLQTDNDTIFIDSNVFSDKGYFVWHKDSENFEEFGPTVERKRMLTEKVDGKIDNFIQGNVGDCWLLSAINGLKRNEQGKKILEKSISIDSDDNITITLQGPKKQYTFTKEQLDSTLNSKDYQYSTGDRDVLAIEMAIEKFKKESITNPRKHVTNMYNYYLQPTYEDSPLEGGQTYNSLHILTGMKSNRIMKTYAPNVILTNNTASVGQLDEKKVKQILDNPNNIVLAGYKTNDREGHAVVLCSMDDKNVYIIDSNIENYNPNRKIKQTKMDKKEFFNNIIDITYTDLSKPITKQQSEPTNSKINTTEDARQIIGGDLYL